MVRPDRDGADRLGVLPVHGRARVPAERPDPVAGPEEGEVRADHPVQQRAQVGLDPPLDRGLLVLRIGVVERPAAEQDAGPVLQVNGTQRVLLQPHPVQLALVQPGVGQKRRVLVVRRGILGTDPEQQKRFHLFTLAIRRPFSGPRVQPMISGPSQSRVVAVWRHAFPHLAGRQLPSAGLADRPGLVSRHRFPPRVRATELWRVQPAYLEQAQRDATLLAIRDQEQAGLDILTDGEQLAGRATPIGSRPRWTAWTSTIRARRWTAAARRTRCPGWPARSGAGHPVEAADAEFLRANTGRTVKMTVPGPFTMAQQAQNDYYTSPEDLGFGYAEAVLRRGGGPVRGGRRHRAVDEPYLQARPGEARKYGVKAINRALDGITGTTAVHLCFGYAAIIHDRPEGVFVPARAGRVRVRPDLSPNRVVRPADGEVLARLDGKTIILGVLNLGDETVESPDEVIGLVRRALEYVPAERLVLAPDCGMKYLPRASAFGKLSAMTAAAATLRAGAA